jgi:hypothetical protein
MAEQQIHPSKVRVGDIIGTMPQTDSRFTVKMIGGPQTGKQRWTFFGRDVKGQQYTSTYGENDLVHRYAKAQ